MDCATLDHQLIFSAIHKANVGRRAWKLALTEDDRQEAAMLVVTMFSKSYNPEKAKPSTFLYNSAKLALMRLSSSRSSNASKQHYRTRFTDVVGTLEGAGDAVPPGAVDPIDAGGVSVQLAEAMECLSPLGQKAIRLVYLDGKTQAEGSRILGVSTTVFCRAHRIAMEQLRFMLSGYAAEVYGVDPN